MAHSKSFAQSDDDDYGLCYTGQPFLDSVTVECPLCGEHVKVHKAWLDPYCTVKFENGFGGAFVCDEHLSEQRKTEIKEARTNEHNETNTTLQDKKVAGRGREEFIKKHLTK